MYRNLRYNCLSGTKAKTEDYHSYVQAFTFIYNDFLPFLQEAVNYPAICNQAPLQTTKEVRQLLNLLRYNHDFFNTTVHDISISTAISAINWLKSSPPRSLFELFGWPLSNPESDLHILIKALTGLLPPAVLTAYQLDDICTLTRLSNSSLSTYIKQHGCTQTYEGNLLKSRARAFAKKALSDKIEELFIHAQEQGLVPSQRDIDQKASKEELDQKASKEELDHKASKDDLELLASKEDLELLASKEELDYKASKDDLELLASKKEVERLEKEIKSMQGAAEEAAKASQLETETLRNELKSVQATLRGWMQMMGTD